ncbi:type II toxin-antitoxin system HicA family toxin [Polyangium aurulentum]|uniref:type II toxin-antitoxin system HicA family toxin n=1 Tax=Polyangium aurulentum TaxID=2567896 RepID=UPI0010AE4BDE|nr:type II toxin-antitoxin system HicA family toxin [Polyangium aurulentum]UQA57328.1 type II toxin-antitoxin system HicA family toxin [Polyangium aurulentum]
MPPLPIISGLACIAALRKLGYREIRQRGSHVRLVCEGRSPVTVPLHGTLDRGTLRSILRTADVSIDQFLELLSV